MPGPHLSHRLVALPTSLLTQEPGHSWRSIMSVDLNTETVPSERTWGRRCICPAWQDAGCIVTSPHLDSRPQTQRGPLTAHLPFSSPPPRCQLLLRTPYKSRPTCSSPISFSIPYPQSEVLKMRTRSLSQPSPKPFRGFPTH